MRRNLYILTLLVISFFGTDANGSPARPPKGFRSHPAKSTPHSKPAANEARPNAASHEGKALRQPVSEKARRSVQAPSRRLAKPAVAVSPRGRAGRRKIVLLQRASLVTVSPLRGSYESLVRQNVKSEADGLERIEDDDDLRDRITRKQLIPLPASSALAVNSVPEDRRYCRPWTAGFLSDLAAAHAKLFHHPVEVSSAVRTVDFQKHLMRINGNAAQAEGEVASPHLTGATIDIAKHGLTRQELEWMRNFLLPLEQAGKIDVEEEFKQACFHITVYKSYAGIEPVKNSTPQPSRYTLPPGLPIAGE
jgi:hypothetical protein